MTVLILHDVFTESEVVAVQQIRMVASPESFLETTSESETVEEEPELEDEVGRSPCPSPLSNQSVEAVEIQGRETYANSYFAKA